MAYIGKQPVVGNFQVCDAISVVNGQAAYTMQVASANVEPENANHMLVSLNGVLQKPGSSFTISGATITFASNLATGDVIDFIILLGDVLNTGTPSDTAVKAASLNNDIISGQTALTAEPDDTDEFLVSDAGTIKRIDYSLIKGGGVTMADAWRLTTAYQGDADISSNLERVDGPAGYGQLGSAMSESSGVFTFPSTGIYKVSYFQSFYSAGVASRFVRCAIKVTTDNSSYNEAALGQTSVEQLESSTTYCFASCETLVDVTDTSNVKVKFSTDVSNNSIYVAGNSSRSDNQMMFIRLGDT